MSLHIDNVILPGNEKSFTSVPFRKPRLFRAGRNERLPQEQEYPIDRNPQW